MTSIKLRGRIVKGTFLERPNRFLARVQIEDVINTSFVPNPGRMRELLIPSREVLLREVKNEKRKTQYDLIAVPVKGCVVSIDSRIPNKLVYRGLQEDAIEELSGYATIKPEHAFDDSKLDFLLIKGDERCLLEVKSVTLVIDRKALFPDAPTSRGRRHVLDLINAKKAGYRACILFLIQRSDALTFSPNNTTDPEFGNALQEAFKGGIEIYAYSSEYANGKISLKDKIRVSL